MKESVSILLAATPKFGEMLICAGCLALSKKTELLDNEEAREEFTQVIKKEAPRCRDTVGLTTSTEFQSTVLKFTNDIGLIRVEGKSDQSNEVVNIYLLDFFLKALWPVLVERYFDRINRKTRSVEIVVNIRKRVCSEIYGNDNMDILALELKHLLLYNHIIISNIEIQPNGDLQTKILIPVPPYVEGRPGL